MNQNSPDKPLNLEAESDAPVNSAEDISELKLLRWNYTIRTSWVLMSLNLPIQSYAVVTRKVPLEIWLPSLLAAFVLCGLISHLIANRVFNRRHRREIVLLVNKEL